MRALIMILLVFLLPFTAIARGETSATQPWAMRITVTSLETNEPITGAAITVNVFVGEKDIDQNLTTDAHSSATFQPSPEMALGWVDVKVRKEGMVSVRHSYFKPEAHTPLPPERWVFKMEKATSISGRVVDDTGKPVPGAHVSARVEKKYAGLDQSVILNKEAVDTDAAGHWTLDGIPAVCDTISIACWHHLYLTGDGYFYPTAFNPQSKLRDGTAEIILHRGTIITGLVRGPDGSPVPNATVRYNPDTQVSNNILPVKTDAKGTFLLGIKAGTRARLIVEHEGFAPAMIYADIGPNTPQSVEFILKKPSLLTGQVVDAKGKPVPGASLEITDWHGSYTLNHHIHSDKNGQFDWPDAPDDEVRAEVSAKGYAKIKDIALKAGEKNQLRLVPPTKVEATVVDAVTGKPVSDYEVRYGAVWTEGDRLIWQTMNDYGGEAIRTANGFTYGFESPAYQYALRIESTNYLPETTPLFFPDGNAKRFTLKLQPAEPLHGRLLAPDGSSAGPGTVYLVTDFMRVYNGEVRDREADEHIHADVDKDGRFNLERTRDPAILVAITPKGVGYWHVGQWEHLTDFTVQPLGTINIQYAPNKKPLNRLAAVEHEDWASNVSPQVMWQYAVSTDGKNHFTLSHVWPGRLQFQRWVPNHAHGRQIDIKMGAIDVAPGQAAEYHIGDGRSVVGQLAMPFAGKLWMIRINEARPVGDSTQAFGPEIADDGKFHIDDLPAGTYDLKIALHELPPENDCGWGRVLGEYATRFTVPATSGTTQSPIDLGLLNPAPLSAATANVGDLAPDFTLKTLDGKTLHLSDYHGKFVLLDFWATWCAPCVAEIPHMKELQSAHAADPRFALIGMDEDEQLDAANMFVAEEKIPWPQARVAIDSDLAKQYGATAIPLTLLIGPNGKVIARDLRGDDLKKAVDAALKQ